MNRYLWSCAGLDGDCAQYWGWVVGINVKTRAVKAFRTAAAKGGAAHGVMGHCTVCACTWAMPVPAMAHKTSVRLQAVPHACLQARIIGASACVQTPNRATCHATPISGHCDGSRPEPIRGHVLLLP